MAMDSGQWDKQQKRSNPVVGKISSVPSPVSAFVNFRSGCSKTSQTTVVDEGGAAGVPPPRSSIVRHIFLPRGSLRSYRLSAIYRRTQHDRELL